MERNSMKLLGIKGGATLSFLVVAGLLLFAVPGPAQTIPLVENSNDMTDYDVDEVDPLLGDGAFGEWDEDDVRTFNGIAAIDKAYLYIQGSTKRDLTIRVRMRAAIGHLDKTLFEEEVVVAQDDSIIVEVGLDGAMGMHPNQKYYVTRISAELTTVPETEEQRMYFQLLEPRYLAFHENTGKVAFISKATKADLYPYGPTTQAGKAAALKDAAEALQEGVVLEAIGSGVFQSATLTKEEIAAKLAARTNDREGN